MNEPKNPWQSLEQLEVVPTYPRWGLSEKREQHARPEAQLRKYRAVEYISHYGDDQRIADVARVSFDNWGAGTPERDERLIQYLAKHEHSSPFRHVGLTVRCHAPLFVARQLVKHRIGAEWNEVSRRYVKDDIAFYLPAYFRQGAENVKQGSSEDRALYTDSMYIRAMMNSAFEYTTALDRGVCIEQARMLLPTSLQTQWIWTASLPAMTHMIRLRLAPDAQRECWPIAAGILNICREHFPAATEALLHDFRPPE